MLLCLLWQLLLRQQAFLVFCCQINPYLPPYLRVLLFSIAKIMQIECRISSLLEYYAEMQLILYKDYASERNESLLSNCRAQLILCKDMLFFRKMQEFSRKCLRVRKITRKSEENRLFVFTIKIINLPKNNIGHTMPKRWAHNDQGLGRQ